MGQTLASHSRELLKIICERESNFFRNLKTSENSRHARQRFRNISQTFETYVGVLEHTRNPRMEQSSSGVYKCRRVPSGKNVNIRWTSTNLSILGAESSMYQALVSTSPGASD